MGRVGIYCRTTAKQIREVVKNNDIWFIYSSLCLTAGVTTTVQRYHLQPKQQWTLEGKRPLALTSVFGCTFTHVCVDRFVFEGEFISKSRTVD